MTLREELSAMAHRLFESVPGFAGCMRVDTILPVNTNFVCKVQLLPHPEDRFNLLLLASLLPNAKYHQLKFAAVTLRMDNTVVLIFESGKVIMMKGRSASHSLYLMHIYRLMLEALPMTIYDRNTGIVRRNATLCGHLGFEGWVVENIVANSRMMQDSVLLGKLSDDHAEQCNYAADGFPGATWWGKLSDGSEFTVKIFDTGKTVYMGVTSTEQVREAHEIICKVLSDYEDTDIPNDPRLRANYRLQHIFRRAGFDDRRRRVAPVIGPDDVMIKLEQQVDGEEDEEEEEDEEMVAEAFLRELLEEEAAQEASTMGPTLLKASRLQRVDAIRNMMENGALRTADLFYRESPNSPTVKEYLESNASNVNYVAIMAILEPLLPTSQSQE